MESELILSVAEYMYRSNILTKKGLDLLYNIHCDPYHEYLYYSVVLRLTERYGEKVDDEGLEKSTYQRLRKNSIDAYIRFYTLKKQLSLDELYRSYAELQASFI